eukprot:3875789-Amphidinium_carterae.1
MVARTSKIHAPTVWNVPCPAATPVTPWSASCQAMVSQPGGYTSAGRSTPPKPSTPWPNFFHAIHSRMYFHESGLTGLTRKKGRKSS